MITCLHSDEVGPIHSFEIGVRDAEFGGSHHMRCNNLIATVRKAGVCSVEEGLSHYP